MKRPDWFEYFVEVAQVISKRSTCLRRRLNVPKGERYELCSSVHAEQNAIINCDPARMKGATIYISGFNADGSIASGKPCLLCGRMIANARIARVAYLGENGDLIFNTL